MVMELDLGSARPLIEAWLREDVGHGDVTSGAVIPSGTHGRARIEARERAVIAGLPAAGLCFELVAADPVEWSTKVQDGAHVEPGETLAVVEGPLATILTAERTALNLLGHLSGIATLTRRFVDEIEGTDCKIVDTRKTTPGLRTFEKYAVRMGGGANHRFGLDDAILIKDNHIQAAGGISSAVARARDSAPHVTKIEVEVEDAAQLSEAIEAGADIIMLDNMTPDEVRSAVATTAGRAVLEVSGGIDLSNVAAYAAAGPDLISVGAITHSAPRTDVALEVEG